MIRGDQSGQAQGVPAYMPDKKTPLRSGKATALPLRVLRMLRE